MDTLYLKAFFRSEQQDHLDTYFNNLDADRMDMDTERMPAPLAAYLSNYEASYGLAKYGLNTPTGVLEKARELEIRVVAINDPLASIPRGPDYVSTDEDYANRRGRMNTLAESIISADRVGREGGKYVILVGRNHSHTAPASPSDPTGSGIPGLSQRLTLPAVLTQPPKKSQTPKARLHVENTADRNPAAAAASSSGTVPSTGSKRKIAFLRTDLPASPPAPTPVSESTSKLLSKPGSGLDAILNPDLKF